MRQFIIAVAMLLIVSGCTSKQDSRQSPKPKSIDQAILSEADYSQIEQRILHRIIELKITHASLRNMKSPSGHQHNVRWVLDDPTKPHGRLNGRRAVFEEDGYWYSLKFYRGQWQGAALFRPIEFGDLKLWFRYGHGGNTSVIAALTTILREEHEAFCRKHRRECPNQEL